MNVALPAGIPIDLYSASGIAAGTRLVVHNVGASDVRLAVTAPALASDHLVIGAREIAFNEAGEMTAFAMSVSGGGVNVRVA